MRSVYSYRGVESVERIMANPQNRFKDALDELTIEKRKHIVKDETFDWELQKIMETYAEKED